jgi:hypothetical protein
MASISSDTDRTPIPATDRTASPAADLPDQPPAPDRWRDIPCPLHGPRFPFSYATKDVFHTYYASRLDQDQDAFERYFRGSEDDKSEAETRLRAELPEVVARDAWRTAFESFSNNVVFVPTAVAVVACVVMPWNMADLPWWQDLVVALVGVAGVAVLFAVLIGLEKLLEPRNLSSSSGLLAILALSAGAVAWLYTDKPGAWVLLLVPISAFSILITAMFLLNSAAIVVAALLNRRKAAIYVHADLSDEILNTLNAMSHQPWNYREIAASFHYLADNFERNWRQLLVSGPLAPTIQPRVHQMALDIAAGLRQTALKASFPTRNGGAGRSFATTFAEQAARQATAIVTLRYGDLPRTESADIPVRSRIRQLAHAAGSVIAAISPITLLIVLPRAFDFTVNPDLNGTLLTVSLAWLALYVVGWLDPKSLGNVSTMAGLAGSLKTGKRGT